MLKLRCDFLSIGGIIKSSYWKCSFVFLPYLHTINGTKSLVCIIYIAYYYWKHQSLYEDLPDRSAVLFLANVVFSSEKPGIVSRAVAQRQRSVGLLRSPLPECPRRSSGSFPYHPPVWPLTRFFCFLFCAKSTAPCRGNTFLYRSYRQFPRPPSRTLAFWADKAPFKGPRLASYSASWTTECKAHRTPSKTALILRFMKIQFFTPILHYEKSTEYNWFSDQTW